LKSWAVWERGRCEFECKLQKTGFLELHHDNAPAHTALSFREFLGKKCIPVLPQAPYSPHLSPCDFYLFPKLKSWVPNIWQHSEGCNRRHQDPKQVTSNPAMRRGNFVGPSMLHQKDIILKGTMLI
jgi:hypothetical protein